MPIKIKGKSGETLGILNIDKGLLQELSKEERKLLYKAVIWEKCIKPLIKSEIWYNPFTENEKVKNIINRIK
ncbi:MAG TPA: hypothetical protein P5136_00180 [Methanofastidiosum sp.]|nr:hypothetical protein [Methanofastidiosum sp.]